MRFLAVVLVVACLAVANAKALNRRSAITSRNVNKIPSWEALTEAYPQGDSPAVVERIFGRAQSWITNTCAVRMSYCLNKAGIKLPLIQVAGYGDDPKKETEQTMKSVEGFRIVYRVKVLGGWMLKNFPKPSIIHEKKSDESDDAAIDKAIAAFNGKKGIIRFDVNWSDASGHLDLWDGKEMWEEKHRGESTTRRYFGLAYKITLWQAGSSGTSTVTTNSGSGSSSSSSSNSDSIEGSSKGPCTSNGSEGHCVNVETCKKAYGEGKYNFIARTEGCKKFPGPIQCCIKA